MRASIDPQAKKLNRGPRIRRNLMLLTLAVALSGMLTAGSSATAAGLTYNVLDYGAKGDGATNDDAAFQAAMSAAPSGSTVVVPAATYRIQSTLKLKSGVTLSGPGATLYMPDQSTTTALLDADGTSGTTISGLTLRSDGAVGIMGIAGTGRGAVNLTVRDLRTENLRYGMKLGSSGASSNLNVSNWTSRGDNQSLYLGNVKGGALSNLDFDCRWGASGNNHNIYLEKGNADLTFDTLRLAGGAGYSLHLYMDSTAAADRGQRITFRHLRLDSPNQGVVVERYDNVSFFDLTGSAASSSAFFVIYTMSNLTVDGFDAAGTSNAFLADNKNGPITGVTIRNGVYHQPQLLSNSQVISGLVIENATQATASQTTTTTIRTTTTAPATTTSTTAATTTTSTTPPAMTTSTTTTSTVPPTPTTSSTTSTTVPPPQGTGSLLNGDFEMDQNGDGRPDSWTSSSKFGRSETVAHGGRYSGRFYGLNNKDITIKQYVGVTPGASYAFSGWVNIPATADAFTFKLQLKFRNNAGTVISIKTIKSYAAATTGWDYAMATAVAPTGAATALMQIDALSLGQMIYIDDFSLGAGGALPVSASGAPTADTATRAYSATQSFTDVPAWHPYARQISRLAAQGVVQGMVDGAFRPDDPVTRQQFAKMVLLTLRVLVPESDQPPFDDVDYAPDSLYPDNYIAVAARTGITIGTAERRFSPEASITRAQMISMVVRALREVKPDLLLPLSSGNLSAWGEFSTDHQGNAGIAESTGLLAGLPYSSLDPWASMTRGEVALILDNVTDMLGQ